jgi:hypothetical protein
MWAHAILTVVSMTTNTVEGQKKARPTVSAMSSLAAFKARRGL